MGKGWMAMGSEEKMLENAYRDNRDFKRYVDRYCVTYGFTVVEALKSCIVREVHKYYEEERRQEKEVNPVFVAGCEA